jgi:hypothetical protein
MTPSTVSTEDSQDEPVYWFVLWEAAIERGEYEEAARAATELRRLGIRVSWANPAKGREVSHAP